MIQKIKDALGAIELEHNGNVYFQVPCEFAYEGVLNGTLEVENDEDINNFQPEHLRNIISNLKECDVNGRQLLKQEFPEEDENEPPLNDIIIYPDGSFSIGYDTGESPAGELFLYIRYSEDFERDDELIYETY